MGMSCSCHVVYLVVSLPCRHIVYPSGCFLAWERRKVIGGHISWVRWVGIHGDAVLSQEFRATWQDTLSWCRSQVLEELDANMLLLQHFHLTIQQMKKQDCTVDQLTHESQAATHSCGMWCQEMFPSILDVCDTVSSFSIKFCLGYSWSAVVLTGNSSETGV